MHIYNKNELFDASRQTKFIADSERVYKMLIGNNIYKTRLDFIREYLQNAMDASKMQLWLNLKADKAYQDTPWETFTPYDLPPEKYEAYKLEVKADIDWDKQKITLSFQDHGIGMEKDCVSTLSHIAGDSWKKRKTYANEIPAMPVWLRPTGGFGIGIQSAFMITNRVEFITKTRQEGCGRKIRMENRRKGGKVSEYTCKDAENGTTVLITIPLMNFIEAAMENGSLYMKDTIGNIYDHNEISKIIASILRNYMKSTADFSIFPITLCCNNGKSEQIAGMQWLYHTSKDTREVIRLRQGIKLPGNSKDHLPLRYDVKKDRFTLWDSKNHAIVIYTYNQKPNETNSCYYKGIHINGEDFKASGKCSLKINYFDYGVRNHLTINRDNFCQNQKEKFKEDIIKYKDLYARMLTVSTSADHLIKCNVTNEIGTITLINAALNVFDIGAEASEQILSNISQKISVKKLNLFAIAAFLQEPSSNDAIHHSLGHISIPENILFAQDEISLTAILADLKTNPYFLYEAQKENSPVRITTYCFVQRILDAQPSSDEAALETTLPQSNDDICQTLKTKGNYIITDPEICRILQNHSVMLYFTDIKEDDRYIMRIAAESVNMDEGLKYHKILTYHIQTGL